MSNSLRQRMLCAIDFHDKLHAVTDEIEDVATEWRLPAEMQANGFH